MTETWTEVPLDAEVFQNLDESTLRRSPRTIENAFINEVGGHSRFPGLRPWTVLDGGGNVFLGEWDGDLIAATDHGRIFRIDQNKLVTDVTGIVPTGSGRIVMSPTPRQLLMCAGGPIVQLRKNKTELLSSLAPSSTHVAYLSGFVLAIEKDSQLFFYNDSENFDVWDPLNFFSAESQPDNITCMTVTEYGEAILGGPNSLEQFEAYPGGDKPFFRRWSVGEGVKAPYTLISGDSGIWAVNKLQEFTRYSGQNGKPQSLPISASLEAIDNWDGAWCAQMHLFGHKFIILKVPKATNAYGSLGVTWLHNYIDKRWHQLYGWDEKLNLPKAWPGNSYYNLFGLHFIGGSNGEIFILDNTYFLNNGLRQQMYYRSAHEDDMGKVRIDNLRFRLKRGAPEVGYDPKLNPDFQIRVRRDNREFGKWQTCKLGNSGDRDMYVYFGGQGTATTFQFEYRCGANSPVEVVRMQVIATRVD